jgi:hypothetical protein
MKLLAYGLLLLMLITVPPITSEAPYYTVMRAALNVYDKILKTFGEKPIDTLRAQLNQEIPLVAKEKQRTGGAWNM